MTLMTDNLHSCTNHTTLSFFDCLAAQMASVEGNPGCAEEEQKENMTPLEDLPLVLKETSAPLNFCGLTPCSFGIPDQSFTLAKSSNSKGERPRSDVWRNYFLNKIATFSVLSLVVVAAATVFLWLPIIHHLHYSCFFFLYSYFIHWNLLINARIRQMKCIFCQVFALFPSNSR